MSPDPILPRNRGRSVLGDGLFSPAFSSSILVYRPLHVYIYKSLLYIEKSSLFLVESKKVIVRVT